jgi:hypothetical protein
MYFIIGIFLILIAILQCGLAFDLFIKPIIEFEYWKNDKIAALLFCVLFIFNVVSALFLALTVITAL